jgi:hypothetical protein
LTRGSRETVPSRSSQRTKTAGAEAKRLHDLDAFVTVEQALMYVKALQLAAAGDQGPGTVVVRAAEDAAPVAAAGGEMIAGAIDP